MKAHENREHILNAMLDMLGRLLRRCFLASDVIEVRFVVRLLTEEHNQLGKCALGELEREINGTTGGDGVRMCVEAFECVFGRGGTHQAESKSSTTEETLTQEQKLPELA